MHASFENKMPGSAVLERGRSLKPQELWNAIDGDMVTPRSV